MNKIIFPQSKQPFTIPLWAKHYSKRKRYMILYIIFSLLSVILLCVWSILGNSLYRSIYFLLEFLFINLQIYYGNILSVIINNDLKTTQISYEKNLLLAFFLAIVYYFLGELQNYIYNLIAGVIILINYSAYICRNIIKITYHD